MGLLPAVLLFASALFAFSLSAVCGGGAGLLLLPLLGQVLPGAQVPAALSVGTATSSLSRIIAFRAHVRWDVVARFVPPALPAVWLGAKLLTFVNPLYLELGLGFFLVANLPLLFRPATDLQTVHQLPKGYLIGIGAVAGFVSGLTGAVGLLFNRFYLRYGLSKEQIVATRAANELLLHIVKLGLYASFGLLTRQSAGVGAVVAVAAVGSSWAMRWLLPRLSEGLFRRIGYGAMVVSGLSLFAGAAGRLAVDNGVRVSYVPISGGTETRLEWRQRNLFALEFGYDEGFELERTVSFAELPPAVQGRVRTLSRGADRVMLEEVFGVGRHSYELYQVRRGKITQIELPG